MPEEIDNDLSWKWLVQSDIEVQTETTICASQGQGLRTNYTKNKTDKTLENPLCRMCGEKEETVQHIIYECKKQTQREYKRRHDTVAKLVHWKLCEKHNLERKEKWSDYCTEGVVEDYDVKLMWNINTQCHNVIEARRLELILVDKKKRIHVSSSMLLYQMIVGYVRKKSKRLKNIRI